MRKAIEIYPHSNNSVVVVGDEEDRLMFPKRITNDLKQIELTLAAHRKDR